MGFLDRLITLFSGSNDPRVIKLKQLKRIGKSISRMRGKYYDPRSHHSTESMGRYFFSIYQNTLAARVLLSKQGQAKLIESQIIEANLSAKQVELLHSFDEDNLRQAIDKTANKKELYKQLNDRLKMLFSFFDKKKQSQIEGAHETYKDFMKIINFNYYGLLRHFDPRIPKNALKYAPNFAPVKTEKILNFLESYLQILPLARSSNAWDVLFDIFKNLQGVEVISRSNWKNTIRMMLDAQISQIFLLIARHALSNPEYTPVLGEPNQPFVKNHLEQLRQNIENLLKTAAAEQKSQKMTEITQKVFGDAVEEKLIYYTEKTNKALSERSNERLLLVSPLNALYAFIEESINGDIGELTNNIMITGQWSDRNDPKKLGDYLENLKNVYNGIDEFDKTLEPNSAFGASMWNAFKKADKNKPNSSRDLKRVLTEINNQALTYMQSSGNYLVGLGKIIKICLEDLTNKNHKVIANWKEVERVANVDLQPSIEAAYKKILKFVNFLHSFVKEYSKSG